MPLLFSKPNESFKKINAEVYKRDVSRNDDNRELAETTETSEQVDILLNSLQEVEGFAIDYANKLSSAMVEPTDLPPIGKFLTSIANAEKEVLVLDINILSRNSIDGLVGKRDKLQDILDTLDVRTPDANWNRLTTQVRNNLTNLLGNLKIKIVNYRQTVPVESMTIDNVEAPTLEPVVVGSGYMSDYNLLGAGFLSKRAYQPRKYI